MKNFFSQISLKRIFSLFTFGTIALLLVVIFFAGKQYLLYHQCESLVTSSQHILFQFTGIKEHINETFLTEKHLNSSKIIEEVQGLDDDLTHILKDVLIPEEFKLNFISQVDLVHLTVTLRSIQNSNNPADTEQKAKLTIQLRTIHAKLTAFNQLITRYTQKQLLGLHRALVGLLTLIIAMVSIMLLVINQYITSPILHYCKALFPSEKDTISLFTLHKSIENMATQPSERDVLPNQDNVNEMSRLYRNSSIGNLLGGLSNELTNRSNGIINYTQAIMDLSQDLQMDQDAKVLLQKLFAEEKKMSELLMHMIQFTNGSEDGAAKSISLENMFGNITGLVQGTLKNDRINLHVNLENPSRILNYHVSDLQLVILSALQSSRVALNNSDTIERQHDEKEITVTLDEDMIAEDRVIITIGDNGAPWKKHTENTVPVTARPWHNMRFCNDFLHTFGGSLQVNRKNGLNNQCLIDIPFSGKRV